MGDEEPLPVTPPLDKGPKILLDALAFEPASVDQLVEISGFSCQTVSAMLLILELEGRVAMQAGGRYVRRAQRGDARGLLRRGSLEAPHSAYLRMVSIASSREGCPAATGAK